MHQPSSDLRAHHGRDRSVVCTALALRAWKHIPEAQRLISSARHNRLSIRACGQEQHSVGVARQRRKLGHGRVLPHIDLILCVAMRADKFIAVLGPRQIAHLDDACCVSCIMTRSAYSLQRQSATHTESTACMSALCRCKSTHCDNEYVYSLSSNGCTGCSPGCQCRRN